MTFTERVAIASAVSILTEHVRADTDILYAVARLERNLPLAGTQESREVWAAVHSDSRDWS